MRPCMRVIFARTTLLITRITAAPTTANLTSNFAESTYTTPRVKQDRAIIYAPPVGRRRARSRERCRWQRAGTRVKTCTEARTCKNVYAPAASRVFDPPRIRTNRKLDSGSNRERVRGRERGRERERGEEEERGRAQLFAVSVIGVRNPEI